MLIPQQKSVRIFGHCEQQLWDFLNCYGFHFIFFHFILTKPRRLFAMVGVQSVVVQKLRQYTPSRHVFVEFQRILK